GYLCGENAGVQHRDIQRTALQRGDGLQVTAQSAAREQPDLHFAATLLAYQIGKLLRAFALRVILDVLECETQGALTVFGRLCGQAGQREACDTSSSDG